MSAAVTSVVGQLPDLLEEVAGLERGLEAARADRDLEQPDRRHVRGQVGRGGLVLGRHDGRRRSHDFARPATGQVHEQRVAPGGHVVGDLEQVPRHLDVPGRDLL